MIQYGSQWVSECAGVSLAVHFEIWSSSDAPQFVLSRYSDKDWKYACVTYQVFILIVLLIDLFPVFFMLSIYYGYWCNFS